MNDESNSSEQGQSDSGEPPGHCSSTAPGQRPCASERRIDPGVPYDQFLHCVHCGLCTAACPTYLELGTEMDSPRGRILLMRAAVDGRLELNRSVLRHLELCLDCRACESACPSGVRYGRIIEPFRLALVRSGAAQQLEPAGGLLDRLARWLIAHVFPYPRRMRAAVWPVRVAQVLGVADGLGRLLPEQLRRSYDMLPPFRLLVPRLPERLPAKGRRRARVALFTGCINEAIFRETNWATARVLQENGCEVLVPPGQVCCGAIHYHAGMLEPATRLMKRNLEAFEPLEVDAVVTNVAGCAAVLKDYGVLAGEWARDEALRRADGAIDAATLKRAERLAAKVRDVHEFLLQLGPQQPAGPIPLRAVYHDACHLAHAQGITAAPRKLLAMVPELELLPLAESDVCCGAAGTYQLTQPEMSERLAERKRRNIAQSGADAVLAANVGCLLQIGRAVRQAGMPIWVAHPIEVLDLSYRREQPPVPAGPPRRP